jgi:hypothetical protein
VGPILGAADNRFRPFVALCAFAGPRLGEAAAVDPRTSTPGALLGC